MKFEISRGTVCFFFLIFLFCLNGRFIWAFFLLPGLVLSSLTTKKLQYQYIADSAVFTFIFWLIFLPFFVKNLMSVPWSLRIQFLIFLFFVPLVFAFLSKEIDKEAIRKSLPHRY